ncbi:hypothetical protein KIN20_022484 [Parelaphostrongylus tenuis]|uniref:Uncharacterized protein n=1 Tax=Parelaphostrongylus tenuis TaxID=148309 RepID=A0AAD5NBM6_PARTN|nr:hypothetical protein KIN20_022484 [Parelaphostrongylus tenuis]
MARFTANPWMIMLLATISATLGCGLVPAGQARTRAFTVTGFTLPVAMVYSTAPDVQAQVPGIASSEGGAQAFVQRLVMQTVFDVLESQGRSALLSDAVIANILGQLTVKVTYRPINCPRVALKLSDTVMRDQPKCIIVGNTVTGICTTTMGGAQMCNGNMVTIIPVTANATIAGTLMTTNIIMSNWSGAMWQSVMNRAVRILALRPFGSHFFTASATVDGR